MPLLLVLCYMSTDRFVDRTGSARYPRRAEEGGEENG